MNAVRATIITVLTAGLVVVLTIAVWPSSATDTARDDGERLGQAITDLRAAETYDDVDNGLTDVREAAREARIHAGDELSGQITKQGNTLANALNGFAGAVTADNEFDQEVYESQLDYAVDDLANQAGEFRSTAPDVAEAFYDGLRSGLEG